MLWGVELLRGVAWLGWVGPCWRKCDRNCGGGLCSFLCSGYHPVSVSVNFLLPASYRTLSYCSCTTSACTRPCSHQDNNGLSLWNCEWATTSKYFLSKNCRELQPLPKPRRSAVCAASAVSRPLESIRRWVRETWCWAWHCWILVLIWADWDRALALSLEEKVFSYNFYFTGVHS